MYDFTCPQCSKEMIVKEFVEEWHKIWFGDKQ